MFVCYLHQRLHLGPVYIQFLSQAASFHAKLSQLSPQRGHHLIETHLNTQHKEIITMSGNTQSTSSFHSVSLVTVSWVWVLT